MKVIADSMLQVGINRNHLEVNMTHHHPNIHLSELQQASSLTLLCVQFISSKQWMLLDVMHKGCEWFSIRKEVQNYSVAGQSWCVVSPIKFVTRRMLADHTSRLTTHTYSIV